MSIYFSRWMFLLLCRGLGQLCYKQFHNQHEMIHTISNLSH